MINASTVSVLAAYEFTMPAPGVGRFYCDHGISEHLFDQSNVLSVSWGGRAVTFRCDNELAIALKTICKQSNLAYGSTNTRKSLSTSKKGKPLHGAALVKRREKLNRIAIPA